MDQLEEIRQSGELRNTEFIAIPDGVQSGTLQEVIVSAQTLSGPQYEARALMNLESNQLYDTEDLPMEVMNELIETHQVQPVGVQHQMRAFYRTVNGQSESQQYQERVLTAVGQNGQYYTARELSF